MHHRTWCDSDCIDSVIKGGCGCGNLRAMSQPITLAAWVIPCDTVDEIRQLTSAFNEYRRPLLVRRVSRVKARANMHLEVIDHATTTVKDGYVRKRTTTSCAPRLDGIDCPQVVLLLVLIGWIGRQSYVGRPNLGITVIV